MQLILKRAFFVDLRWLLAALIWTSKRHTVKLETLHATLEDGGYEAPSYKSFYAAAQLQRPLRWNLNEANPEQRLAGALGPAHHWSGS